jgi:hypothetical protein
LGTLTIDNQGKARMSDKSQGRVLRLRELALRLIGDARDLADQAVRQRMMKVAADLTDMASVLERAGEIIVPQAAD